MKDRITPALVALADILKHREPPFAGLQETIRIRLAGICQAFALMDLVADENARDCARAVLGALHAAALTWHDEPISDEEQVMLVDGCWRALQAAVRPSGHGKQYADDGVEVCEGDMWNAPRGNQFTVLRIDRPGHAILFNHRHKHEDGAIIGRMTAANGWTLVQRLRPEDSAPVVEEVGRIRAAGLPDLVLHRVRGVEELNVHPAKRDDGAKCTGLTARWCPIHGDCTCPEGDDLDEPECPLHRPESTHGLEVAERFPAP